MFKSTYRSCLFFACVALASPAQVLAQGKHGGGPGGGGGGGHGGNPGSPPGMPSTPSAPAPSGTSPSPTQPAAAPEAPSTSSPPSSPGAISTPPSGFTISLPTSEQLRGYQRAAENSTDNCTDKDSAACKKAKEGK